MFIVPENHPPELDEFTCAQAGCPLCLNGLLVRHERLVVWLVRQVYPGHLDYADLVQEGRIGLWQAILHFEPERGTAFSSYAYPAIRHRLWWAVKQHDQGMASGEAKLEPGLDLETGLEAEELRRALIQILQGLPERLGLILEQAYGLEGEAPSSLAAIGRELGLSRERVRQLREEALHLLRLPALSLLLRDLCEQNSRQAYRKGTRHPHARRHA